MKIERKKVFPRRCIQVAEGNIGSYGVSSSREGEQVHFTVRQGIKGDDYIFEVEVSAEEFEMLAEMFASSTKGRAALERAIRKADKAAPRSRR